VGVDQLQQLVVLGFRFDFCTFPYRLRDAMAEVIPHQTLTHGAKSFLDRGKLDENVGAIAVFLDHALQAADLAFNAPQPVKIRPFDFGINAGSLLWSQLRFATARRYHTLFHPRYPLGV